MRSTLRISSWAALVIGMIFAATARMAFAADPTSAELLKDALGATATINNAGEKAVVLSYLVMSQARTGDIAGAKQTAESIAGPFKIFAYGNIAAAMAYAGDIDGAKALLDGIGADVKSTGYEGIVEAVADKGDVAKAKTMAVQIADRFYAAHAQEHIAMAQAAAGDLEAAKATISAISGPEDVIVEAYVYVAEIEIKAGKADEGRKIIDLATAAAKRVPGYLLPVALADIAEAQTRAGNLAVAMQIVEKAKGPDDKALFLGHIADAQIKMGDLDAAKKTASSLSEAGRRSRLEADLATAEAAKGDKDGAGQLLKDAQTLAASITDVPLRAIACMAIGKAQVQVNGAVAAADWARSQKDPQVRALALMGVVAGLPDYHAPKLP